MSKVFIEVEEGVVEKLDEFIKWCYYENLSEKTGEEGYYPEDPSWIGRLPEILMSFARPISKGFGLYPYTEEVVRMKEEWDVLIEKEEKEKEEWENN